MSKDKISDYSATANSNTDIGGINIDEGCAPSGINDAIRTLMKQLKDFQQGTSSDVFKGPLQVGAASSIEVTDNTNAALRITQLGTGNALLVEDSSNPDSSPFVINADGRVIVGTTQTAAVYGATTPFMQVRGTDTNTSASSVESNSTTASRGGTLFLTRSRSTTIGGVTAVESGDILAAIAASGADGTGFIQAALITAEVDGTPGTNDMPGRLVFSTTADGASTPTERARITSTGEVLIGGTTSINNDSGITLERAGNGGVIYMYRNDTSVVSGNSLGYIGFVGNDTTSNTPTTLAFIQGVASGTHAAGDNPTDIVFGTTPYGSETVAEAVRIKNGGGLSISRTAVTSPAAGDGNVFSGTYTPTITNVTNVAASTASVLQYMRVGSYVQISGRLQIDPTTTGTTTVRVSLPVASNFSSVIQAGGTFCGSSGEVGYITAVTSTDDLQFQYTATSTANNAFYFSLGYWVI
jgi:hypothetical protein